MKPSACLIQKTATEYRVSYSTAPILHLGVDETPPDDLASAVLDLIQREKPNFGDGCDHIVFCPHPSTTLFVSGGRDAKSKKLDRNQLKYAVESLLPLDAENMAADFIVTERDFRVLAAEHDGILPLVEAFHRQGLHFRWIAPAPLLSLQQAMLELQLGEEVIVWDEPDHCDVWMIDAHGPKRWNHITGSTSTRAVWLKLFTAQVPESYSWLVMNSTSDTREILESLSEVNPRLVQTEPQSEWLHRAANRLCRGTNTAWFDLRDGVVAGADRWRSLYGWMMLTAVCVLAMLMALPAACWWKSGNLSRQLDEISLAQQELFKQAFPGQPLPEDIVGFISQKESEARGSRNSGSQVASTISAFQVLHIALSALSQEDFFIVDKFNVENGTLTTEIRLRTFDDVPTLKDRFQQLGIRINEPKSSLNGDGTVTATFVGELVRNQTSLVSPSEKVSRHAIGGGAVQ
jgi:hypothetical protein